MTIDNNIQNQNQQSVTVSDPTEENLSWLQEFHVDTIGPLTKNDQYIEDGSIGRYLGYSGNPQLPNLSNIKFRIHAVDNPGWSLNFDSEVRCIISHQLPIDIEEKTNRIIEDSYPEEREIESLFINSRSNYYSFSSALYLNLAIEFFRCGVDSGILPIAGTLTSMRDIYKQNNPLLTWFEEFYFSCCDGNWEHDSGGAIGLIAVQDGWIFCFSVLYLELVDKNFENITIQQEEGVIECYKKEEIFDGTKSYSRFIIRAHSRGLIEGLRIFKEWVES